jgi:dephospho-CoA kinase
MDFPGEAKLVDAFLQRVSSDTFLIDDVRYPTTVEIMRRQGIHVYLVFVHVDQPLRHHRAVARDQVTASEQRHADNAKTESRIPELAAMADLEVNNTGDLTHTLQAVLPILRPHIHEE